MVEATRSVVCGSSSQQTNTDFGPQSPRTLEQIAKSVEAALDLSNGWWLEEFGGTFRGSVDGLEKTVGRNTEVEGDSNEASDGNEQHVIRNWRKGNLHYKGQRI